MRAMYAADRFKEPGTGIAFVTHVGRNLLVDLVYRATSRQPCRQNGDMAPGKQLRICLERDADLYGTRTVTESHHTLPSNVPFGTSSRAK
jgi:hypothetical protein